MTELWHAVMDRAQQVRHDLHAHPELSWQEHRTAEQVRQMLTEWGVPWWPCADTGTVAQLNAGGSGQHIALRGDMDALPIREQTGKDWSSLNEGCMHACGHDGHTATLLATAQWLKHHEQSLMGPVTLLFQPAEEGGHGAKKMLDGGALAGVDFIYGWHNWPAIGFGRMACPDGIVMCGNGTFQLRVIGRGGHASQPELCRDPVLAASAIAMALQQAVSRRLAPQQAAVLSVTSIEAPSAPTVIPQEAYLGGSIRVPDQITRELVNELISDISQHTAQAYGVKCEVTLEPRYDATINHAQAAQHARQAWLIQNGSESLEHGIQLPIMASEDFSYYLQAVPGAFALIGADDGIAHQAPCHSPHYDFNDRLIPLVTRWFASLVGAPVPDRQS